MNLFTQRYSPRLLRSDCLTMERSNRRPSPRNVQRRMRRNAFCWTAQLSMSSRISMSSLLISRSLRILTRTWYSSKSSVEAAPVLSLIMAENALPARRSSRQYCRTTPMPDRVMRTFLGVMMLSLSSWRTDVYPRFFRRLPIAANVVEFT